MLDKEQNILVKLIAINYNCYIAHKFLLHREDGDVKFTKIGRFSYNKQFDLYHLTNNNGTKYEGDSDFETVLVNFLNKEGLL